MATIPLPITTRLQTRDGSSASKDGRYTNVLMETGKEGETLVIKRPGFAVFDGSQWTAAASLGSTALPDGNIITFTGNPAGGANNATFHYSIKAGNYSTFDPLSKSSHIALSNGNLTATSDSSSVFQGVKTIIYKSTGKWYCEYTCTAITVSTTLGILNTAGTVTGQMGVTAGEYTYHAGGYKFHNNVLTAYGTTYTNGDVISIVFDAGGGTLNFWKNGVDQGQAYSGITGSWTTGFCLDVASKDATINMGASAFAYTPPAGYTGWVS